ncbi:MAG: peptide-methionine (R)-S-oxide reductase [Paracoccaceae bacterium]
MTTLNRRHFLGGTALAVVTTAGSTQSLARTTQDTEFQFELQRSDAEWRALLNEEEFRILREGGTEKRHSSPLVAETRDGTYRCKGCDLTLYDSVWKKQLDIGYVFFRHARKRTVLTDIDGEPFVDGADVRSVVPMEVHCRRCASHLGHVVSINNDVLHCINGASLVFEATEA